MIEPIPKTFKEKTPPKPLKRIGKVAKNWNSVRKEYLSKRLPDHTGYWICDDCNRYTDSPDVDHRIKRSVAPHLRYEFSNLQLLCRPCHQRKDNGIISSI